MKFLELKIHPPIIFLISAGLAYICSLYLPFLSLPLILSEYYWCLCITGGMIAITGIWEFRKAKTTIDPTKPQNTSSLVSGGIYKITRNPMYLGLLLVLMGIILKFGSLSSFIALPFFIFYITIFQIKPEERIIESIFGQEYGQYKNKVRRWL